MTAEDRAYADALNLMGSEMNHPESVAETLHRLHDRAEASHRAERGDQ